MAFILKNDTLAISFALGIFVIISILLYLNVDTNSKKYSQISHLNQISGIDVKEFQKHVKKLHFQAGNNAAVLDKISNGYLIVNQNSKKNSKFRPYSGEDEIKIGEQNEQRKQIPIPYNDNEKRFAFCESNNLFSNSNVSIDVQMLNIYERLPFDNKNGGVWKQGWPIEFDPNKILKEKKLEVIVIPHSHNDPGWLKTFESYFEDQTKHILDLMVIHLNKQHDMKFIYAEMSFFELWWSKQTVDIKERVKKLLANGQFEIVTGGWVMTDEANAHYYSTIMELIEGHEFLSNHLGFKPVNHWSIDPFGLSPTLAYILNQANFKHMTVQRVHYYVKKYLAQTKQLEFLWRQLFAGDSNKTDIITHMFPFYSYDVPHTCGPDPKVCCQFDFRRLRGGKIDCPWGRSPIPITKENVAERAELLYDQYRKKAQLYGLNTILVPLGDDFRYDLDTEWLDQYSNYKILFEYMNAKHEWNINARFGTLADYFEIFEQRLKQLNYEKKSNSDEGVMRHIVTGKSDSSKLLPILSGDFFTYADRDDHYWSGYFTSRPFYKHMDRSLQHLLRTADIFYSLVNWQKQMPNYLNKLYNQLVSARRSMSLFQHHDGVTGTARTSVMRDYGEKMAHALADSKRVIAFSVQFLLNLTTPNNAEKLIFKVDEEHFVDQLPEKLIIRNGSIMTIINPLGQSRKEVICIYVGSLKSTIYQSGVKIPQQIQPIFYINSEDSIAFLRDKFELCFLSLLPAFGLSSFDIIQSEDVSHKAKISMSDRTFELSEFDIQTHTSEKEIQLDNELIAARFDSITGYLKSIRNRYGDNVNITVSFVRYGARPKNSARTDGGDSLSGAYLFLPDGPAQELTSEGNSFFIVRGPVRQFILVKGPTDVGLCHKITLDVDSEYISILNNVNLAKNIKDIGNQPEKNADLGNYELAMRVKVPTIKGDNFFTDLNGFQMIRRRRHLDKLPIQAHFYPMPGSAFIEDENFRVSLIGRQALGVASLRSGEMQVMLDRRLIQDDDRGLGQKIDDNLLTESNFRLYIEKFAGTHKKKNYGGMDTLAFHSLSVHHASMQLHYPPVVTFAQSDPKIIREMENAISALQNPFPCDIHPVLFRTLSGPTDYGNGTSTERNTLPKREAALVLHRLAFDCTLLSKVPESTCSLENSNLDGKIYLNKLFHQMPRSIRNASLTLLHSSTTEYDVEDAKMTINQMELRTVKIEF